MAVTKRDLFNAGIGASAALASVFTYLSLPEEPSLVAKAQNRLEVLQQNPDQYPTDIETLQSALLQHRAGELQQLSSELNLSFMIAQFPLSLTEQQEVQENIQQQLKAMEQQLKAAPAP